ncbi:transporter [Escherichia coli]|uniref:Transporter n=1 Tax=Escherichia coli TaxID=562 RepID=A0A377K057_ECOLX|nr:transporter [Escherichia coli]
MVVSRDFSFLLLQEYCHDTFKLSAYSLADTHRTIITQFALGSVYTWSLFNGALSAKLGAPVSQVAFSFGLLSLGLAISSSVAGKLQERFWC